MQIKFFPELVKNFESLFDTKRNYDTIIYAGEEQNVQEIYAHSIILCCQSTYFHDAFLNDSFEIRDGIYIINKPDVPFQILNKIIRYLYCGKIELKAELGLNLFNLLIIASEFNLDSLVEYVQELLIIHQKKFIKNYIFEVLELTTKHECLKPLQNFCLKIICHVPSLLFKKDSYLTLSSLALEIILKQDDFILDEIDIWNLLIHWTQAQNPNVNHNPSRWTKENVTMMKQTIHGFIPLIRFQDVSSNNYYERIFPYEKLLPESFNDEIMQFYLVPNVTKIKNLLPSKWPKFDSSRLINKYHFRLFAKWIDGNANNDVSYNFKLLYRASRDGRTSAAFHSKCDNKGATILVSTVLNSNHLIGGYNPLQWDSSNQWKSTKESFIYSFTSRKDFQTAKVGYSNNDQCSIGCFPSVGPTFGNLIFNNYGSWTCDSRDDYPAIDMPERFIVDDYEVFQVTKTINY